MNPTDFRNILNVIDLPLSESIGLANRKAGQTFINDKGELISFVAINFFPESGKYKSQEELDFALSEIEKKYNLKLHFVNAKRADYRAFGITSFKDANGQLLLIGKYFKEISPIFTKNNWANSEVPGGFKYNSKASLKMSSGLMPQDILANFNNLTIDNVVKQITSYFGADHPLAKLAKQIAQGKPLPITVDVSDYPDISFEGFRDYFCELLQPIAIINGMATGNAADAEKAFFGAGGFKKSTITFDNGKNNGLFDSLIVDPKGRTIQISTKGKGGAKASIKNLVDAVNDIRKSGNTQLLDEYKDIIDIIEIVQDGGYANGPLNLARKFNMISGKEVDIVLSLKTIQDAPLTRNLQKMYDERAEGADQTKLVPFYNMLAAIAYRVADYINENTDFSNAAADILNSSALIQVNTTATQKGNQIVLARFDATYPSKAVADIKFSAQKTYFSSGNKGNFTFKINANVEDEIEGGEEDQPSIGDIEQATAAKVKGVSNRRVDIAPPGAIRAKKDKADVSPPREKR